MTTRRRGIRAQSIEEISTRMFQSSRAEFEFEPFDLLDASLSRRRRLENAGYIYSRRLEARRRTRRIRFRMVPRQSTLFSERPGVHRRDTQGNGPVEISDASQLRRQVPHRAVEMFLRLSTLPNLVR